MIEEIYNGLPDYAKQGRFLFRGFSIEKKGDEIILLDIRTAFYSEVSSDDLLTLYELGFLRGATYLLMLSDQKKIERFKALEERNKELAKQSANPRKKQEHKNTANFNEQRVKYYELQVRRWQKQITQ